jgi:hypothetical protein
MNPNEHDTQDKNYIVLLKNEGEYYPVKFQDGSVVIYGDKTEAMQDASPNEIVAEIIFPK